MVRQLLALPLGISDSLETRNTKPFLDERSTRAHMEQMVVGEGSTCICYVGGFLHSLCRSHAYRSSDIFWYWIRPDYIYVLIES